MGYALELGSKTKPLFKKKEKEKQKISQSPVQSVVTDTAHQRDTEMSIQHGLSKWEVTSHGHHMGFPEQGRELLVLLAPEAQAGEELHVTK